LRIEVGQRDLEAGVATVVDRLTGEKTQVPLETVAGTIPGRLDEFHDALYKRAEKFRDEHIFHAETFDELIEMVEHGFVYATHCGDADSEKAIQEATKATVRCIPLEGPSAAGTTCVHTGR